jgi:hypothetical protein
LKRSGEGALNGRIKPAVVAGAVVVASALGLTACSGSSETTCHLATPASAMATHGSLAIRELRRDVVTIVTDADRNLNSAAPSGATGSTGSDLASLGDNISQMATELAGLKYPPEYLAAAQRMLTTSRSLAASLRSGEGTTGSSDALVAAVDASQQFYSALGIPSVCTTTSGN